MTFKRLAQPLSLRPEHDGHPVITGKYRAKAQRQYRATIGHCPKDTVMIEHHVLDLFGVAPDVLDRAILCLWDVTDNGREFSAGYGP